MILPDAKQQILGQEILDNKMAREKSIVVLILLLERKRTRSNEKINMEITTNMSFYSWPKSYMNINRT